MKKKAIVTSKIEIPAEVHWEIKMHAFNQRKSLRKYLLEAVIDKLNKDNKNGSYVYPTKGRVDKQSKRAV